PLPSSATPAAPSGRNTSEQLDLLSQQLGAMRSRVAASDSPAPAAVPPSLTAAAQPNAAPTAAFSMFGFDDIIRALLRGWFVILICALAGAGLVAAYAVTLPNTYQAVAEILIEPRGLKVLNDSVSEQGLNSEATVAYAQSQVRIILSSSVIEPVIAELELTEDPEFNGEAQSGIGKILSIFGAGPTEADKQQAARDTIYEGLFVERINQTFLIMIGMTTQDPQKSARIANAIARTYIEDESGSNSRVAREANENLSDRAEVLRQKVQDAEEAVEAHKLQFDLVDADGKLVSDVQIARLNEQLALARVQTGDARTRAQAAEEANPADALEGSLPSSISSSAIDQLRLDYTRARQNLSKLASKLGSRHPLRIEAAAEVASARQAIENEVARLVRSVREDFRRAVAREQDLVQQLNSAKAASANDSEAKVKLRQLEATLNANRDIYRTVLQRLRETGEQQNIRTESTRLLSEALPPSRKSGPQRRLMVVAGGVAGGGLGALLALLPLLLAFARGLGGNGARRAAAPGAAPSMASSTDDLYAVAASAQPVMPPATAPVAPPMQAIQHTAPQPQPVAAPPMQMPLPGFGYAPQPYYPAPQMMMPQPMMQPQMVQPVYYPQPQPTEKT
ncbi:MAG: GumC family protein, partial [Pseudomonadota bacterium]